MKNRLISYKQIGQHWLKKAALIIILSAFTVPFLAAMNQENPELKGKSIIERSLQRKIEKASLDLSTFSSSDLESAATYIDYLQKNPKVLHALSLTLSVDGSDLWDYLEDIQKNIEAQLLAQKKVAQFVDTLIQEQKNRGTVTLTGYSPDQLKGIKHRIESLIQNAKASLQVALRLGIDGWALWDYLQALKEKIEQTLQPKKTFSASDELSALINKIKRKEVVSYNAYTKEELGAILKEIDRLLENSKLNLRLAERLGIDSSDLWDYLTLLKNKATPPPPVPPRGTPPPAPPRETPSVTARTNQRPLPTPPVQKPSGGSAEPSETPSYEVPPADIKLWKSMSYEQLDQERNRLSIKGARLKAARSALHNTEPTEAEQQVDAQIDAIDAIAREKGFWNAGQSPEDEWE